MLTQEEIDKFLDSCGHQLFLETDKGNFAWSDGKNNFELYEGSLSRYVDEKGLSYKHSFEPKPGMLMHSLALVP